MSMVGTFLVRSGILTSVHSFAVDPTRGAFLLVLLALYIGGALALFGARIATVKEGQQFDLVSREGFLVANNLALSAILGIVLIGTLYPLLTEAMGTKVSVGPPLFQRGRGADHAAHGHRHGPRPAGTLGGATNGVRCCDARPCRSSPAARHFSVSCCYCRR